MNYLNKIKIGLQNAHGSPQYFFQFWTGYGKVDAQRLMSSFSRVLSVYNANFVQYSELVQKSFNKELSFLSVEYEQSLLNTIENFLENSSIKTIEHYGYSPIILIYFYHQKNNEFGILLMNNHIHLDGISGYLFFRDLVATYNLNSDENYNYSKSSIADVDLIKSQFSEFNFIEKVCYHYHRLKIPIVKKYFNKKLNVQKIYNFKEDKTRKVNYTYINIPYIKKFKNRNNLILTSITNQLLKLKGPLLHHTLVLSIPLNVRKNKEFIGNHAIPYQIVIQKKSEKNILSLIEKKMKAVKSMSKRLAIYARTAEAVSAATVEDTFNVFHSFSNQMHCYVTNIQDYFHLEGAQFFSDTKIGLTGLFNYPLQANIGSLFSITYCKNSVGISFACSPMFMSKKESQLLLENIKASLVPQE